MKKLLFVLALFTSLNFFAQKKVYYNFAINNCEEATTEGMINNCLIGSHLLDYDFTTINGESIKTAKIKKPIVIIAASTRFAPCWGQIPALNKMVEKYHGKIKFVMMFLDDVKGIRRMEEKLDKRIDLLPPTKSFDNKAHTESYGFVHKLDYPTLYLINKDKEFVNIKRGAAYPSKTMKWDEVNKINEEQLEAFLKPVL